MVLLSTPDGSLERESTFAASSDDELMTLARGGLAAAFDALVRRHQVRALRVASRQLGESGLAPDAVQNAFLEIYHARARYQARGRFSAYFYRILLNQCRMLTRAQRRKSRTLTVFVPEQTACEETQILARERERELAVALGRLSEKLRQVVLLRYSAELRYEEIAETLDLPVGTVKRRLFDAMAKLRDLLEEA